MASNVIGKVGRSRLDQEEFMFFMWNLKFTPGIFDQLFPSRVILKESDLPRFNAL